MIDGGEIEEWKLIPGWADYAASNTGLIKRLHTDRNGHKKIVNRILTGAISKSGYMWVTLSCDGYRKMLRVNRVICQTFHGSPPTSKHHAAHQDGDRLNNNSNNLRWATGVENELDKRKHGTATIGDKHWSITNPEKRSRGVNHGRAKLNDDAVRKIRADTRYQRAIAADFGVTQRVIWMVKKGLIWGHVV
jgi:hypothetical protein